MEPDEHGVEVSCTNCYLSRTFQERSEIPDKYRNGCPNCGYAVAIKPIGEQQ